MSPKSDLAGCSTLCAIIGTLMLFIIAYLTTLEYIPEYYEYICNVNNYNIEHSTVTEVSGLSDKSCKLNKFLLEVNVTYSEYTDVDTWIFVNCYMDGTHYTNIVEIGNLMLNTTQSCKLVGENMYIGDLNTSYHLYIQTIIPICISIMVTMFGLSLLGYLIVCCSPN